VTNGYGNHTTRPRGRVFFCPEVAVPSPRVDEAFATAVRLHTAGDLAGAEAAYRQVLTQDPNYAAVLSNLGTVLVKTGREDEAVGCYRRAIAADPKFADAHFNLANLFRRTGKLVEAEAALRECIRNNPKHASAYFNLGVTLATVGNLNDAESAFRKVTELEQQVGEAHLRLGDILLRLGRPADAVDAFRKYTVAKPNDPKGLYNLALALANDNKPADATPLLHAALKLKPDYAEAHNALGLGLELLGRKDDAVHHYQEAVRLKPTLADAWSNLGVNLCEQGRSEEAIDALTRSLEHRPNAPAIYSNLVLLLNYSSRFTPEQVRDEHKVWADRFAPSVPLRPIPHGPHDPTRRLRIGYVSSDFRQHTVAGFIEILLRHHDRGQVEVFAYPSVQRPDDTTERLKTLADHWRPINGLSDATAAGVIRSDKIDVLIDLGGHTAGNRLMTFASRPACVQTTVFGYPTTTGLGAMDYRITDPISDPPGATEHLSVEQLLRLPEFAWVYRPPADVPPVSPLPALTRRPFTFGCLNNPAKISDACLDAWAKLIQTTPGSRLVLMAGQSAAGLRRLSDRFVKAGILRDRVQLVNRLPREKYFEQYADIDVALDPFPYNGGVTTCDALWMGVPVLCVAGTSYVARQGVMQMLTLGLGEFVVASPGELTDAAKMWMNRRPELAEIRAGLRDRLAASPLCDAPRYVRHLEAALRRAWVKTLPG
jgi:protein O-GlcNAc transferase